MGGGEGRSKGHILHLLGDHPQRLQDKKRQKQSDNYCKKENSTFKLGGANCGRS